MPCHGKQHFNFSPLCLRASLRLSSRLHVDATIDIRSAHHRGRATQRELSKAYFPARQGFIDELPRRAGLPMSIIFLACRGHFFLMGDIGSF